MDWMGIGITAGIAVFFFGGLFGVSVLRWIQSGDWEASVYLTEAIFAFLLWPLVLLYGAYKWFTEVEV